MENTIGTVQIADDVVAIIAGLAATEVEGVASMAGNITKEIIAKFGMKNLSKGVKVEVLEDGVIVDVVITINLDKKIMEVSKEIQDKIQTTIKDMTDMDVIAVNVRVAGVNEVPEA